MVVALLCKPLGWISGAIPVQPMGRLNRAYPPTEPIRRGCTTKQRGGVGGGVQAHDMIFEGHLVCEELPREMNTSEEGRWMLSA